MDTQYDFWSFKLEAWIVIVKEENRDVSYKDQGILLYILIKI